MEYRQKLVEKWSTSKDVRSVAERRFVPASIHNTTKLKRDMIEAQKVKEDRRRSHTRAGKDKPKAERKSELFSLFNDMWLIRLQRLSSRNRNSLGVYGGRTPTCGRRGSLLYLYRSRSMACRRLVCLYLTIYALFNLTQSSIRRSLFSASWKSID